MNTFKSDDLGGLPLKLNDFRWIADGLAEAIKGIVSAYGVDDQNTFVISGCERTFSGGDTFIAEGFVSIGGEICYVPAHDYPDLTVGQVDYWERVDTFDPTGLKEFQSTVSYDTYAVRVGQVLVGASVPAGQTAYDDALSMFQAMRPQLNIGEWIAVTLEPNIFTVDLFEYFMTIDGFIKFKGELSVNTTGAPGGAFQIGTLPVGFRPAAPVFQDYYSDGQHWEMAIFETGNIYALILTAPSIPANHPVRCYNFPSYRAVPA